MFLIEEMRLLLIQSLSLSLSLSYLISSLPASYRENTHRSRLLFPDSSHYSLFSFSLSLCTHTKLLSSQNTPFRIALYNGSSNHKTGLLLLLPPLPLFFSQLTISLEYHQRKHFLFSFFFPFQKLYTREKKRARQKSRREKKTNFYKTKQKMFPN